MIAKYLRLRFGLSVSLLLLTFACKQNPSSDSRQTTTSPDTATEAVVPRDTLPDYDQRMVLEGEIGDYPIVMDLEFRGSRITGSYRYLSQRQSLNLKGEVLENGGYSLTEYDAQEQQTGYMIGGMGFQGRFTGTWMKPDSSSKLLIDIVPSRVEQYRSGGFLPDRFRYDVNHIEKVSQGRTCVIDIYYPYFYDLPQSVLEKLNGALTGPADSVLQNQLEECQVDDMPNAMGSEVMEGFTIVSINGPIMSITKDYYAYFSGAAHGNYGSETLNFDLRTGEQLAPLDLFVAGYDSVINRLVRQRLSEKYGPDVEYFSFEAVHDKQDYEIALDSLHTYFDPYEIAPYAAGQIRVAFGYDELEKVIRKDGPLALRERN